MLEEAQIKRIGEMRGGGFTIAETAKALEISESSVKKYSSSNFKNNEIDEKTGNSLTEQLELEGYDFVDEIRPLVYKLKAQANEQEITLFGYLKDISSVINKFLRITDNPERLYYLFYELANNLTTITSHIEANDFMNAITNFYDREIEFEKIEAWLLEQKETCDMYVENKKRELIDLLNQIDDNREALRKITNSKNIMLKKLLEKPHIENLETMKKDLEIAGNRINDLEIGNQILIEKGKSLEKTDKDNEIIRQDNIMFNMVYERLYKLFPNEINAIIRDIDNENK